MFMPSKVSNIRNQCYIHANMRRTNSPIKTNKKETSKLSSENVNMMSSFAMTKINYNRNNSIVFKVLHIKLHLSPYPTDDSNYAYTILLY